MLFFKKKEIINNKGFTLMEAMVTIAIMGIMSAVYLTDYRTTNQKIIVDQAVAGLITDLRLAQSMATNGNSFNGEIPLGGYGININNSSSYIIYADCVNDHIYNSSSVCSSGVEKYLSRDYSTGVGAVTSSSLSNITFTPPFASVWINGAQTVNTASIILRYGTDGPSKEIIINRVTGQISVN